MFLFDYNWQLNHILNQFFWPINFVLIAILVILGYLAYKKPALAAGGVLILLPTYLIRSKLWFIPVTFLEASIWIVFIGWLIQAFRKNTVIKGYRYPFRNLILLILATATISIFIAPNLVAAGGLWKAYFVEPIMFFIVLINVMHVPKNRSIILWSLGISSLSVALLAVVQKFSGFAIPEGAWVAQSTRRVTAMFTSPNAVGLYLAPIIAIYFGWLWQKPQAFSTFNQTAQIIGKVIVIGLGLTAIVFTVSHGTWLGLLAALVFLLFFGWSKLWTSLGVFIVLIVLLLVPVTQQQIIEQVTFSDPAGLNRIILWNGSFEFLTSSARNFVLGAGIFGFPQIQDGFRDPLTLEPLLYPHNILLNFWLELGLVGMIGFILLFIRFFRRNVSQLHQDHSLKWLRLGVMAAMITILVHGLIDVPYFKNDLAVLFWTILALAV